VGGFFFFIYLVLFFLFLWGRCVRSRLLKFGDFRAFLFLLFYVGGISWFL